MPFRSFSKYIYPILLAAISIYICIANYHSGTWLSGWDTLHPEFNIWNYWRRILQSVWQEHQGLGAVATQAHASEIPRMLIYTFLYFILPIDFLRWSYFFLMLIIGPLGIYYLTRILFGFKPGTHKYSFLAGLFYLLNLGTLQHFYVPLEMFATLYGFIGWLFLSVYLYLRSSKHKYLIFFLVLTFFSAPIAHTPTLWFVYFVILIIFLITYYFLHKTPKSNLRKRITVLAVSTILVNLFWILPTLYFTFNHADDVANAKITRLFSEEAILHNQEYANIWDISILKGYLFNWRVHTGDEIFTPIFSNWNEHLYRYGFVYLGYMFVLITLFGIIAAYKNRKKNLIPFLSILLFSVFFLLMETPPFGFIFGFLQNSIPLFKEAIRLPYTKFSIPLIMSYSIFFGYALYSIAAHTEKHIKHFASYLFGVVFISLIAFSWPAFKGDLIGGVEKVAFPKEYFQVFNHLNNQPENTRIATLPANNMFGWVYYDWEFDDNVDASYQGAGFTWFLSKYPILEREFDRWYPTNEDFYNEFQYAIYSENSELLEFVLRKYNITHLLFDHSIVSPGNEKSKFTMQTISILDSADFLRKAKPYNFLVLYELKDIGNNKAGIETPTNYSAISDSFTFSYIDPQNKDDIYNYIEVEDGRQMPFLDDANLSKSLENLSINIPLQETSPEDSYFLRMPEYDMTDPLPVKISSISSGVEIEYLYPTIKSNNTGALYKKSYKDRLNISSGTSSPILLNGQYMGEIGRNTYFLLENENRLVTFDAEGELARNYSEEVNSAIPTDCFGGEGIYGKRIGDFPGSVALTARNKNVCLEFMGTVRSFEPVVYEVSFRYRADQGSLPLYCLHKIGSSECLNMKYENKPLSTSDGFSSYTDYVYADTTFPVGFYLILETEDKSKVKEAEFRSISVKKHGINAQRIYAPPLAAYPQESIISVNKSDFPLSLDLGDMSALSYTYVPSSQGAYYSNPRNCDGYNEISFDRILQSTDSGNPYFSYKSLDAISCDRISTKINPNASYLVTFNSRNIAGKPLDICIDSDGIDKCLLQDRLSGNGLESFVLPSYPAAGGISISIGNQSIGSVPTENHLYGIEVRYIPYEWLKGISIKPANTPDSYQNAVIQESVDKKSIYKYEVTVLKSETTDGISQSDKGLVIFNQSFEKGWTLYNKSTCLFGITTPLTCRKADADHILAKNWANAWIVPANDAEYVIIFWPQYLQFTGYITIGILIIIAGAMGLRRT